MVESRSETLSTDGVLSWMVSRTIYDDFGRAVISTSRFLVPGDTPLGEDPATGPVPTQISKTIYDTRGRTIATERYTDATVALTQNSSLDYSPQPILTHTGTLETVSETLYDSAGRVDRTISNRQPISSLSVSAALRETLPATYPTHGTAADPYADANLTSGVINDTLFDSQGRQYASLGHPLPAEEVGLTGPNYDGNLVRIRTETIYDSNGQGTIQRSGLAHVETLDGTFVGVYDVDRSKKVSGTLDSYSHTIYDGEGRVERTEQRLGIIIDIVGQASSLSSVLTTGGSVISFSATTFNDANRVVETTTNYGLRSQTLYGQHGEVVESRSETLSTDGVLSWMVSRTIYDDFGRAVISTSRFLVPGDTPLGEDPATGPVPTQISKTIYDDRGRTIATERYTDATVALTQNSSLDYSPQPILTHTGTLETVSETLYDSAGRVDRTISNRQPVSSLSVSAALRETLPATYPTHGTAADPYADANLTSGVINDTLFDSQGRQYASLGHPLPAEEVGLTGTNYDGNLVRIRTEPVYDSNGQATIQRTGLAHVETLDGTFVGVYDADSVDTKSYTDELGNQYRMEYITGGTISYDADSGTTTRTDGTVHSYTLTRFDVRNRPIAEMQQTAGTVTAVWSDTANSFVVPPSGGNPETIIPTRLSEYDADGRLSAVELPAVADPNNSNTITRPRYQYQYDERGNQTAIIDPLGHETRFTFTDRGQQASRTLPLGFGVDGIFGTADDPFSFNPNASGVGDDAVFTERMTYDDRGRQATHVSFEGVVTENIYDSAGRMSAMHYYASESDFAASTISETREYAFDERGRNVGNVLKDANGNVTRIEETVYDDRGRILFEKSPEGILGYGYDNAGRMSYTAVFNPTVVDLATDPSTQLATAADRVTHYAYDILGRLVSVQEDATPANTSDATQDTAYTFDLQGRMDTTELPNGVTSDNDYDALGRLDVMTDTDPSGNLLAEYDYEVRADGKRTAASETFWFDANEDGQQTTDELKTTDITWTYDNANRLTDEVMDHHDDSIDRSEHFEYDLTGNRTTLSTDLNLDGIVDDLVTYDYDANDRLVEELLDSTDNAKDRTTTYSYDQTQQTQKAVTDSENRKLNTVHFAYNLQGRMSSVINDGFDASGTLNARERTSYTYDSKSFRTFLLTETGTSFSPDLNTENWQLKTETQFLADHHNHTGYTQTIRETKTNADGSSVTTDYTFGHDEISQRVVERDAAGNITSDTTHLFGHDGHGSVRMLTDLSGVIAQVFTFAAYGSMVAVHSGNGSLAGTTEAAALTSLGYSGEHFDGKAQQQYLRARFYNPANGRFNRLDPFAGNSTDPQSFHKYTYAHGDPVQFADPSGLLQGLAGFVASGAIIGGLSGMVLGGIDAAIGGGGVGDIIEGAFFGGIGGIIFGALSALLIGTAPLLGTAAVLPSLAWAFGFTAMLAIAGVSTGLGITTANNRGQAIFRGVTGILGIFLLSLGVGRVRVTDLVYDFFGGKRSQFKGAINVDLVAEEGIQMPVNEIPALLPGQQAETVYAINPRAGFLASAAHVLRTAGRLIIVGHRSNPHYSDSATSSRASSTWRQLGFKVVQEDGPLPPELDGYTFRYSDGTEMPAASVSRLKATILNKE